MKRQNKISGRHGFTLVELAVVVACLALLVAILLPALARAKEKGHRAWCNNFLKQIGLAFRTWEGNYADKYPMSVSTNKGGSMEWGAGANMFRHFQVMSNEISTPYVLACLDDDRKPASDFAHLNNSNLSYFIGLDTDETFPEMPISGDRNLITNGVAACPGLAVIRTNDTLGFSKTMHNLFGNVGLADGSVQQCSNAVLQQLFQRSGTNVNRLAMP